VLACTVIQADGGRGYDPSVDEDTGYVERNEQLWDRQSDQYQERHGGQLAASGGTAWGVWQLPESELHVLGDVRGRDVLEYGCGAAQWSIALRRLGARVTGIDLSERQLMHARESMATAGVEFPLVHGNAEATPFDDASFDIVFCDYGAMTFADPYRTVPEAARLLRPGGLFAFCVMTPLAEMTWPASEDHPGDRLLLDYWDLHEMKWEDEPTSFTLPYGTWIGLFVSNGFAVEDLLELRPPAGATSSYRDEVDREWARRWPLEQIWRVRRT
jgi:SAM-dependent methyltransferase